MTELFAVASVAFGKQKAKSEKQKKKKVIIRWQRSGAKREFQRQIVSGPSGWFRLREVDRKGRRLLLSAKVHAHAEVALGVGGGRW